MIELLFALVMSMAECSLDVVGTAEVYFIAHYQHEAPSTDQGQFYDVTTWHTLPNYQCKYCSVSTLDEKEIKKHVARHAKKKKPKFTYRSPVRVVEDDVVTLVADWFPVAYRWYVQQPGENDYGIAKECGEVPNRCLCSTWGGLVADPEACTVDVIRNSMAYLVGYYLHEDPKEPGMRYVYESGPVKYKVNETVGIDWEGYPVAVEWFMRPAGDNKFEPAGLCGEIPAVK